MIGLGDRTVEDFQVECLVSMKSSSSKPHDIFGKSAFRPPGGLLPVLFDTFETSGTAKSVASKGPPPPPRGFAAKASGKSETPREAKSDLRKPGSRVSVKNIVTKDSSQQSRTAAPGELDLFSPLPPQFREIGRRGFSGGCDFVNVANVDVEALQESPGLQATTLFLQRAYAPDKLQVLQQAQPLLECVYAQPGGDALGDAMIRYMLHESGHQRGLAAKLMVKAITDNLSGVVKGKTMSIAQVLKHEGEQLGKLQVAQGMLLEGLPLATVARIAKLPLSHIRKLKDQSIS